MNIERQKYEITLTPETVLHLFHARNQWLLEVGSIELEYHVTQHWNGGPATHTLFVKVGCNRVRKDGTTGDASITVRWWRSTPLPQWLLDAAKEHVPAWFTLEDYQVGEPEVFKRGDHFVQAWTVSE